MNGAPGSSSAVRADHAGANISNVRRPSKIAWHEPITAPRAAPIWGSNPNSNVQDGSSNTPSRLTNSCTLVTPTVINSSTVPASVEMLAHTDGAFAAFCSGRCVYVTRKARLAYIRHARDGAGHERGRLVRRRQAGQGARRRTNLRRWTLQARLA